MSKQAKRSEARPAGSKVTKGKGSHPTKGGSVDPHAHCTPESGCEVAAARATRDLSAPERRREAQTALLLSLQTYVKAAIAEGINLERVKATVASLVEDAFYLTLV